MASRKKQGSSHHCRLKETREIYLLVAAVFFIDLELPILPRLLPSGNSFQNRELQQKIDDQVGAGGDCQAE